MKQVKDLGRRVDGLVGVYDCLDGCKVTSEIHNMVVFQKKVRPYCDIFIAYNFTMKHFTNIIYFLEKIFLFYFF